MVDLKKLISSSEGNLEDCDMFSYDTILDLVEQLRNQSKDSGSLVKIWCTVSSYKKSMEFKKHNYELITEENKSLMNEITALQNERSQIEMEKTKLRVELHNMRLTAENSGLKAAIKLQAKENGQLPKTPSEKAKEEQIMLTQSLTQSLDEVKRRNSELKKKIARYKNLCIMMEKDSDAHKNGEFSCHNASSTTHCKKDMVLKLREELESIETKLQQNRFHCQGVKDEINLLQQKSAEKTAAQEKCEVLEGRVKQHEEEVLSLKTHREKNMVERSEVEKHKKTTKKQLRSQLKKKINSANRLLQEDAASEQQKEQREQQYIMSMEQRIKNIETEMVEIKSRTISNKTQLRLHKKNFRAELKMEESLKYELEKTRTASSVNRKKNRLQ